MERSPHERIKENAARFVFCKARGVFCKQMNQAGYTGPYWKHIHKQEGPKGVDCQ